VPLDLKTLTTTEKESLPCAAETNYEIVYQQSIKTIGPH